MTTFYSTICCWASGHLLAGPRPALAWSELQRWWRMWKYLCGRVQGEGHAEVRKARPLAASRRTAGTPHLFSAAQTLLMLFFPFRFVHSPRVTALCNWSPVYQWPSSSNIHQAASFPSFLWNSLIWRIWDLIKMGFLAITRLSQLWFSLGLKYYSGPSLAR